MPVERISMYLKPDSFFQKNPALDVPPSDQSFNQSTLHKDAAVPCSSCSSEPKL
jgi:primary-amine oxidase